MLLGLFQVLTTTVFSLLQLGCTQAVGRNRKLPSHAFDRAFFVKMLVLGVLRFGTVVLSLVAIKYIAVSFTETVKSAAPLFTVVISRLLLGQVTGLLVNLSLLPVMTGLVLCSANELSFDTRGFLAALATNLIECCQNVYCKMLLSGGKHNFTATQLQFYASLSSLLLQAPMLYMLSESSRASDRLDSAASNLSVSSPLLVVFCLNGVSFHLQSFVAYVLVGCVSSVTYSVANTLKRALLILFSVLYFGNAVTPLSVTGTIIVLLGVIGYDQARRHELSHSTNVKHRIWHFHAKRLSAEAAARWGDTSPHVTIPMQQLM